MPRILLKIPQMGEGLQEARLVAFLKNPGDHVRRDEPIYQMETDKAVLDVESPYDGELIEWLAKPDDIVDIGADVARMEVAGEVEQESVAPEAGPSSATTATEPAATGVRNLSIPPRTKAYAKEQGLSDEVLATIPFSGSKLMPADVDAFLSNTVAAAPQPKSAETYEERSVPAKQRLLNSRLMRANQLAVPGTMTVVANWEGVERMRAKYKASESDFKPSAFTLFSYAVVLAIAQYPALRTSLVGEEMLRTFRHVALGIAVGLPDDELVLAVVEDADTLTWTEFALRMKDRVALARQGKDQVNEQVMVSLTSMQSHGLRDAVPVVVPPSVATLFLGEPYNSLDAHANDVVMRRTVNLALTFDHRIMNGVGAANFLNAVKKNLDHIEELVG